MRMVLGLILRPIVFIPLPRVAAHAVTVSATGGGGRGTESTEDGVDEAAVAALLGIDPGERLPPIEVRIVWVGGVSVST